MKYNNKKSGEKKAQKRDMLATIIKLSRLGSGDDSEWHWNHIPYNGNLGKAEPYKR